MSPERTRPLRGLSSTADGREVPSAQVRAQRLGGDRPAWQGWAAAAGVGALALLLRVIGLGHPKSLQFDETYYAKDAWALIHHGYVQSYVDKANDLILDGTTDPGRLLNGEPSMVVHPEVGKWMIGLGEGAFGMDPFGWRIAAAVTGSLMCLVMVRLLLRLTGSLLLATVGGLLLCFDGMHLVLSRLALLDIFLAFWLLAAVHCIVADRQWFRARLAAQFPQQPDGSPAAGTWGPVRGLLFRPWLLAAGVCFGLAVGTKWTALYPLAAFGLLVWAWSAGARRSFGVRWAWTKSAVADGLTAFVHLVLVALVVYVASWTGWLIHAEKYEQSVLSDSQYTKFDGGKAWPTRDEADASGLGEVTQSLRSLWYYHQDVFIFHTEFLNDSTHGYASKPSGWLILNRPVGVTADNDIQPGDQGCQARADDTCMRQVLILGTPVLWWAAAAALVVAVVRWVGARDWRFGLATVGALATWLPWLQYDDRPIFIFYAIATLPFTIIALTLTMGLILGPDAGPTRRRTLGVIACGTFLVLVLVNFAWFWPIWTGELITRTEWATRIWFSRWI